MVLLISYDLRGPERPASYEAVKDFIKREAISFRRPLYSQWLVETAATPQQWADALVDSAVIDQDDRLFIVRVQQPCRGWLPKEDWNWLQARL